MFFQLYYRLTLAGLVRSALSRSYHPLLSKTKHRAVYDIVPQEQLSPVIGRVQHLITSLASQTNSRKTPTRKTTFKKGMHSSIHSHVEPSLTSSNFFAELSIANEAVQLLRGFLEHSGVHWEEKGGTSHNSAVTCDVCVLHKDNTAVTVRTFKLIWRGF